MPPWSVAWSDGTTCAGPTISPHSRQVSPRDLHEDSCTVSFADGRKRRRYLDREHHVHALPPDTRAGYYRTRFRILGSKRVEGGVPCAHREHVRLRGIVRGTLWSNAASDHVTFTASPGGPTFCRSRKTSPCHRPRPASRSPSQPPRPPLALHALAPCRVFDTRGLLGHGHRVAGSRRVGIPHPRRLQPLLDSSDGHRAVGSTPPLRSPSQLDP